MVDVRGDVLRPPHGTTPAAVKSNKPTKSQGPDNIHPMIMKKCKKALLLPLKLIFEKSVADGKIPEI